MGSFFQPSFLVDELIVFGPKKPSRLAIHQALEAKGLHLGKVLKAARGATGRGSSQDLDRWLMTMTSKPLKDRVSLVVNGL